MLNFAMDNFIECMESSDCEISSLRNSNEGVRYGDTTDVNNYASRVVNAQKKCAKKHCKHAQDFKISGILLYTSEGDMKIVNGKYEQNNARKNIVAGWENVDKIGCGVNGMCFWCRDIKTQFQFCMKKIAVENFRLEEVFCLTKLSHPGIVKLYGVLLEDRSILILMELCDGKDLQYTMNKLPTLNELDFTNIMINLMAVMEHMAKEGIVHGDIKGTNVILLPNGTIKVVDFGAANLVKENLLDSVPQLCCLVENFSPKDSCESLCLDKDKIALIKMMFYLFAGKPLPSTPIVDIKPFLMLLPMGLRDALVEGLEGRLENNVLLEKLEAVKRELKSQGLKPSVSKSDQLDSFDSSYNSASSTPKSQLSFQACRSANISFSSNSSTDSAFSDSFEINTSLSDYKRNGDMFSGRYGQSSDAWNDNGVGRKQGNEIIFLHHSYSSVANNYIPVTVDEVGSINFSIEDATVPDVVLDSLLAAVPSCVQDEAVEMPGVDEDQLCRNIGYVGENNNSINESLSIGACESDDSIDVATFDVSEHCENSCEMVESSQRLDNLMEDISVGKGNGDQSMNDQLLDVHFQQFLPHVSST